MTIDPVELERLSKAATAPGALIADKGAFLVALETAYRTGQLVPAMPSGPQITDDQIKHMANRFLGWKLPENFRPDNGISFEPVGNKGVPGKEYRRDVSGTNLLDAVQAEAMVRYMVEGIPTAQPSGDEVEAVKAAILPALWSPASGPVVWDDQKRAATEQQAERMATAAITAYEAVSGVAKMRDALEEMRDHRTELNDRSDYARGWNEARWKFKKLARDALGEQP